MRVPELVLPAGNPARLEVAFRYGADAVYLGLKRFSLRSFAGNFDWDQLEWALGLAAELGRRVYVVVNVQPFDHEYPDLAATLRHLEGLSPHGVVVADPGVLALARRVAPTSRLHLSTQASVSSAPAARFWAGQGIERIVLARELSLEQLAALGAADLGGCELETFAHGAVCIAWSGRCFLSLYWAGPHRDPRHGSCAQGCRWPYRALAEARHPERVHRIAEDEWGTYFFDARDLCAMPVLDRLVSIGVHALKVEGRTRGLYYVAMVADAYRHALDRLAAGDVEGWRADLPRYEAELKSASKRGFSTHFLTGAQDDPATYLPSGSPIHGGHASAGQVVGAGEGWVDVKLTNKLEPGALLELCAPGLVREPLDATVLRTPGGDVLDIAKPGQVLRFLQPTAGGPLDMVRRVWRDGERPADRRYGGEVV